MTLSDVAIRRPIFTSMIMCSIIVFGLVSYRSIGIDLFPRIEFPVITVLSVLPGADPETVELTVTDLIEEAVSTISSIKHLRSTSTDGVSQVIIEFELNKPIDVAYQEVVAKIGTVRSELPDDLEEPVVEKFDVDASPIMAVVVSGPMPIRDLTFLADTLVKERLQRIANVGQVKMVGGRFRQIWLLLDRAKLEGYQLSVQDVIAALRSEHVEFPGGRIETGPREYVVKTKAEFESQEQFNNMLVAYRNDAPIRVKDIGRAEDGLQEERSLARLDETRAISLLVRRQSGTNTVQVAHALKADIEKLRRELEPRGVRLAIAQDMSRFIEHSVDEVKFHLLFGGSLAVLIVFMFLRNVRSTFISSLVLPTSIIGTFILMNALDFTQNMMTLLALSLAIGLLIDDAIVVQENIMRHIDEGMAAREAASIATHEITLAVLATTLSVIAVFVPVAFMEGVVGRFFYQFGMTVTFAVSISMFVSFTLDPMLSSRILRKAKQGRLWRVSERFYGSIDRAYERLLAVSLRHRWVVVGIAIGTFAASAYFAKFLRSEFLPLEDQSEFNVRVKAPLGASLATTDAILERIHQRVKNQPWLEYVFVTIGADELQRVNEGVMYVKMKDKHERTIGQKEAMSWLRQEIADITEAKLSVEIVPRVSGGGRKEADVQFEIRGRELDRLEAICSAVIDRMKKSKGYVDIDTTYEKGKPEVNVYVKRDQAADLGVDPMAVATTIKALIGGDDIAKFKAEGKRYDVSVRLLESFRDSTANIEQLMVRGRDNKLISLRNVARIRDEAGPVQIDRYNRARQITILANLQRDKKVLGEAVAELTRFVQEVGLPTGYSFGFAGQADTMGEAASNMVFAVFLAVIVVYMVLASQFESLIHPFTIMLAMPLSLIGAIGLLILADMTLNIYTAIGIVMLLGLVTKNGVLLVDFTNTLRHRDGLERDAAILKAGPIRLRPILMTTLALVFGMLPVALGTGAGAESRQPMAIAVIGGLTTSTLLTLIVVPAVYTIMDDLSHPSRWRILLLFRTRRKI